MSRPFEFHCPKCEQPARITRYGDGYRRAKCVNSLCGNEFRVANGLPAAKVERWEKKTAKGSGQIAGRITIPQYKYGSTRLS